MHEERSHILSVPETLEGWAVLHEVVEIDWRTWKALSEADRSRATAEAAAFLKAVEKPAEGQSALFSLLGHKGDLLLLHFRKSFDELNSVELAFRQLALCDHLKRRDSYVSYVELGMYEMTVKLHREFLAAGLKPETEEWNARWKAAFDGERQRMKNRIFAAIPDERYFCFYPMDKKRGEQKNWYEVPIDKRQTMMRDHGMIGRKYAGQVTQIITGSIGFDDWEWGVYLFAKDPVVFKKLIYEMRFDEASAAYALFGPFTTGLRIRPDDLPGLFSGKILPGA
jgi:chlorite dismutase